MKQITFFSPFLKSLSKYRTVWNQIESVMEKEGELFDFVPNANDIWVRDFMPLQLHNDEFLIYQYNPDYLQGEKRSYITNCRDAFLAAGGREALSSNICTHTNLILDGGNMIKCVDKNGVECVIMTTKVLYENPSLSHHEILLELEECLNTELILIPWDTTEPYGHADGMVRSVRPDKLLLNCYEDFDSSFAAAIRKALGERFEICELKYGDNVRDNSWCHLNYLELSNVVLVPVAGLPSDNLALQQIETFTKKRSVAIHMPQIINEGGALHCVSWTMSTKIFFENKLFFCHPTFYPQCQ